MGTRTNLEIDDFEVGIHVTVLQGKMVERLDCTGPVENSVFNGLCMEVLAIDLPYIVIRDQHGAKRTFDVREGWVWKKLSKEFAEAAQEDFPDDRRRIRVKRGKTETQDQND